MTKKELVQVIRTAGYPAGMDMTKQTLEFAANIARRTMKPWLKPELVEEEVHPPGNWHTAKDWFPTIEVDQETREVVITTFHTVGRQKKATVATKWCSLDISKDHQALYVRGKVSCYNWSNYKTPGLQNFCFAVFVGDSGHVYIHRAPASKGWMNASPDDILKRLRKLGIGADRGVIQQGDFLLKPANGQAHPDAAFVHERMGVGHHKFEIPVLYHWGQFWVQEPTLLIHHAVDGIQHPDVTVPPGKWIVGTTASQLWHRNAAD